MGEILKINEQRSTADALRQQIRHTESDITETVHTLEQRLSPRYLRQRGARQVKRLAWQGTAKLLDLAQRRSVQASLVGAGALWMLIRSRKAGSKIAIRKKAKQQTHKGGTAAKSAGAGALWLLMRRTGKEKSAAPAISRMALAATAAKAFLSGARSFKKSGTTRPGRKVAWRGLATAIGAALGSYWYSHKGHKV